MKKISQGKDYKVIAVVLAAFSNDEEGRIIQKMIAESKKHNCKVVFFSTLTDFYYNTVLDQGEKKIFETICVERFDAIILLSETFKQDEEQIEMVQRAHIAGVPVITLDKLFDECYNTKFDYGDVFRTVVEHMVETHGYRTINYMGGMRNNDFSEERLNVFKEVLAKNHIPFDEKRVYYGEFWCEPTKIAMQQMFEDGLDGVEAIICANDAMAIEVMHQLHEKGYRIPEDIAISGLDGIDMEKYCRPRLTTGVHNEDEFIRLAFEMIDKQFEGVSKYTKIYSKMQVGQSCGCGCGSSELMQVASEMIQLKSDLHREINFQQDMNRMVGSFGNHEDYRAVTKAIPQYLNMIEYKDFWFCSNLNMFGEHDQESRFFVRDSAHPNYTNMLEVLHYSRKGGTALIDEDQVITFGEIIPDLEEQLEKNDYILILPIHERETALGYAALTFDIDTFWSTAYAAFITGFGTLLEMQKAQKKLMNVYMKDSLTGLYNRNGFYQLISRVMDACDDQDMTIISIDMDRLKYINDTFGHAEGDEALKKIAQLIRSATRSEISARIGGDEFLIAFVGYDIDRRTEEIVKGIKEGVALYNRTSNKPYELHASIGAYTNRIRNRTLDHFLKQADDLMYARKYIHRRERGDI